LENLELGSFTGEYERQMREGSGSGASVAVGAPRGEAGGKTPLQGILKDT